MEGSRAGTSGGRREGDAGPFGGRRWNAAPSGVGSHREPEGVGNERGRDAESSGTMNARTKGEHPRSKMMWSLGAGSVAALCAGLALGQSEDKLSRIAAVARPRADEVKWQKVPWIVDLAEG